MKAMVFDTETTGTEPTDRIIEAAYLELDDKFEVVGEFNLRYDPQMPIGLGAMAAHHIMPSELIGCPPYSDFVLPDTEYVIGHNVDFDMRMVGHEDNDEVKRICTLAIARRWLPNIGSHSQTALMYHFMGEAAKPLVHGAHAALVDVKNCFSLLGYLQNIMDQHDVSTDTFEQLWEESERCRIPTSMTFGKHDKEPIKDLPFSYKNWLLAQPWLDKYLRIAVEASV